MAVYTGAFLKKWTRAQTGAETRAQNFVNWIATQISGSTDSSNSANFGPISASFETRRISMTNEPAPELGKQTRQLSKLSELWKSSSANFPKLGNPRNSANFEDYWTRSRHCNSKKETILMMKQFKISFDRLSW